MNIIKKEVKHIISFLEKWTELDVMYYFRGGAVLFSTQFLIVLSTFLLSVGFAYLTSKELFGKFQFVLAIIGTLSVFTMPGTNTAVMLGVSQGKDGTFMQGIKFKLKWSLFGILGLLVTAGYFYFKHEPRYASLWPILIISMVFFPIVHSFDLVLSFFVGRKRFDWSCMFQLITEAASALVALGVLFLTRNLIYIIAAFFAVQVFGYLLGFRFVRSKIRNNEFDSDFNSYSFHLTVINFIPYMRMFFDKLVVSYFLGFAATAVYAIGTAMAEQLYAVSKSVGIMVFPKLAVQKKNIHYEIKRRTGLLALFFIVVAGVAALLAPIIIPFFFSEQYRGAVIIAQLLLVATIPRAIAFVLTKVQEVQREKKKLYKINLAYAGVEMVALLILAPFYGMYGIIVAKALSNTVYFVSAWRSLR